MDEPFNIITILERKPPSIKTKEECYSLYHSGFFGNKVRTWDSIDELKKSRYKGKVSLRSRKKIGWGKAVYNLSVEDAEKKILDLNSLGVMEESITINESPPDDRLIFQGELTRNEKGLYILYSEEKMGMNDALKKRQKNVFGLKAEMMLRTFFFPGSLEHIYELLELFPEDIIEFSCYEINVGIIEPRNVIIWEVRNY